MPRMLGHFDMATSCNSRITAQAIVARTFPDRSDIPVFPEGSFPALPFVGGTIERNLPANNCKSSELPSCWRFIFTWFAGSPSRQECVGKLHAGRERGKGAAAAVAGCGVEHRNAWHGERGSREP